MSGLCYIPWGYRFRLHRKDLPGTPDIVLPKYKTVIFVNGCFWHGHEGCSIYKPPKSNMQYWEEKIARNKERDRINAMMLQELGWQVLEIWECELKNLKRLASRLHDSLH